MEIPTHFAGIEFVRVSSVSLSSSLKTDKKKCVKDETVKRVGAKEGKSEDGDYDISCSTLKIECTTYKYYFLSFVITKA